LDKAYSYLGGDTFRTKDKGVSAEDVSAMQSAGIGEDYTLYVIFQMEWH
jgi:hypothetical protein